MLNTMIAATAATLAIGYATLVPMGSSASATEARAGSASCATACCTPKLSCCGVQQACCSGCEECECACGCCQDAE